MLGTSLVSQGPESGLKYQAEKRNQRRNWCIKIDSRSGN